MKNFLHSIFDFYMRQRISFKILNIFTTTQICELLDIFIPKINKNFTFQKFPNLSFRLPNTIFDRKRLDRSLLNFLAVPPFHLHRRQIIKN